jgi:hypothetical protein
MQNGAKKRREVMDLTPHRDYPSMQLNQANGNDSMREQQRGIHQGMLLNSARIGNLSLWWTMIGETGAGLPQPDSL